MTSKSSSKHSDAKFELISHNKLIKYPEYILVTDIGGTSTRIAIVGIKKNIKLFFSLYFQTKNVKNLASPINTTIKFAKSKGLNINTAVISSAGPIEHQKIHLTNASWNISKKNLLKHTKLKSIFLLNDFESAGYGINLLHPAKTRIIKQGISSTHTRCIIGAGTGLGKAILIREKHRHGDFFSPVPSEGGHADFAPQNITELKLSNFIKKNKKKNNTTWEDVLSGQGVENIYYFLKTVMKVQSPNFKKINKAKSKPLIISQLKKSDKCCKETFKLFYTFYARVAKNFALNSFARGGVFIAGGIISKTHDALNDKLFIKEFLNHKKLKKILKEVPIKISLDPSLALKGAAFYYLKRWAK